MGLLEAHAALKGKVAVVVGGCGEIQGRAYTLALAKAGVHIAACDNHEDEVASIVPEVEALGVRILAYHADVADPAALDAFYDRVEQDFGQIDIVVNVPTHCKRSRFEDSTHEDNARDIRMNYGYILDSCRRAIPLLRRSGGGSIVNFTTIEAHRGAATFAVYAGAKAATTNFSKALAVELGADQIRVNLIAPDTSPAKTSNGSLYPEDFARIEKLGPETLAEASKIYVPMKRDPTVEDLANGLLFLVSDLSRSITGTTLHIDGGTSAGGGWIDWPDDGFMPAPLGGSIGRLFSRG
ncbi:SDR family oxidoreductase (plasmid) [Novosphingobium sp. BL-8A]|uniref:SDR family NAD(P)-dependent oxidoreductase n=1 Tax=Novosphingobium sp. BL-8A TaxID=3127639 RepID=UPI003756D323